MVNEYQVAFEMSAETHFVLHVICRLLCLDFKQN